MVMMVGLLCMTVLVIVPFTLASARYVVLRSGRPAWLRRRLAARTPHGGVGLGATVTEELHAFLNANKRVTMEQRQTELVLRDDTQDGAPPRMGVDLDAGTAVVQRRGPKP
ncbi:DUF6191 domain-containing protein [Streptomyces roseoverticillatus]|uniref:DUF6191 domain-containing protein n=1 Tax=Streptomyces roseoverticillatus TaxID=66429 RepID=A0ABV3J450_9ACTN